jgi:type I restriction enzyme M protein
VRKDKIVLVNASREFKKGQPKNYIPDESIHKIADAFIKGEDIERFVKVITREQAAENDYNLSPSRYVDITEKENYRSIPAILDELEGLEKKAGEIDSDLQEIFRKMGVET